MIDVPGKQAFRRSFWLLLLGYLIYGVSLIVPAVDLGKSDFLNGPVPGWACAWIFAPAWPLNAGLLLLALAYWRLRRTQEPFWRIVGAGVALAALVAQIAIGFWLLTEEGDGGLLVGYFLWLASAAVFASAFITAPSIAPSARDD